jgi:molybdopterin/thiamine biosynthesis adenylyltransferase
MAEIINRYGRQEMIEGWNQDKLKKYKIAIVGSGHISNFLSASLAAVGVGDIKIYDDSRAFYNVLDKKYNEREFLVSRLGEGRSKVEALEKKLAKINPLIDVYGMQMDLDWVTEKMFEKPDMIVTCVNDTLTIAKYYNFASERNIHIYMAQGDDRGAFFTRHYGNIKNFENREQEGVVSEVISGLLAGEITKKIMGQEAIEQLAYFTSKNRFGTNYEFERKERENGGLEDKKVLVIGAGALGNFLGLGLSHAGVRKMYLADDDEIETTNLNRQILFYEKVGEKKAQTLAERLSEINPDMNIEPILKRIDENYETQLLKIKPDMIMDCVDNLATRAILNHFALRYGIPLISGGTDWKAGQVVVFEPGKSPCLNCRLGSDKALVEARTSQSCINAPTPSVVTSNHIIGGLMAAEARCVLRSDLYGEAVRRTIKYDSEKNNRIGLIGGEEGCGCKRRVNARAWIKKLIPETTVAVEAGAESK